MLRISYDIFLNDDCIGIFTNKVDALKRLNDIKIDNNDKIELIKNHIDESGDIIKSDIMHLR